MKRQILLCTLVALAMAGCGRSNWNIGQDQVVYRDGQSRPATSTSSTSTPVGGGNDILVVEEGAVNAPIEDKTYDEQVMEAQNQVHVVNQQAEQTMTNIDGYQENVSEVAQNSADAAAATATNAAQDAAGNYHISTIIDNWGQPNSKRAGGIYVWQSCQSTGKYVEKCEGDTCRTAPETTCCDRELRTNTAGYVTNLKEALAKCM